MAKKFMMETCSLFISWPLRQFDHAYYQALCTQICERMSNFKQPIELIYIDAHRADETALKWLLDTSGTLSKTVPFANRGEYTLEIGIIRVDYAQIKAWQKVGINRIVIRYDEDTRVHTAQLRTMILRIASFIKNISIDLYVDSIKVIECVGTLPITHISLYTVDAFIVAKKAVQKAGFAMYEWQHFAKPGYESAHAQHYWDRKPYIGVGAGACSFDGIARTKNSKNISAYSAQNSTYEYQEQLSPDEIYMEKIMMALRRPQGVCKDILLPGTKQKINDLIAQDLLCDYGDTVGYTDRGFLLENQILTQLI